MWGVRSDHGRRHIVSDGRELLRCNAWADLPFSAASSIMWAVVFGIFGKVYIPEGDAVHPRMFHAVWLDLFNMVLWLVTEINALRACFGSRD